MKTLKYLPFALYRGWFYFLMTISIVCMFPFLVISILKESWYPFFFKLARVWATFILYGMGLFPVISRETVYNRKQSYMFVSNHTSMTDIMLMFYATKNPFVFVGKRELARIPVFGFFYKRTCILVDRNNVKSRFQVFKQAQQKINQGWSVCIFPEGGVPEDQDMLLDEFKDGAFRLAIEHKLPIAPMTFHDNKKRFPYQLTTEGGPGILRVKIHSIIPTEILELEDKRILKNKTREVILNELKTPTM